jgi:hypothetical protein
VFYSKEGAAEIKFSGDGRYNPAGTINKSLNLQICYPDVTKVKIRFQRIHHIVNYSSYKVNKLKLRRGVVLPVRDNNYGMRLVSTVKNKKNKLTK